MLNMLADSQILCFLWVLVPLLVLAIGRAMMFMLRLLAGGGVGGRQPPPPWAGDRQSRRNRRRARREIARTAQYGADNWTQKACVNPQCGCINKPEARFCSRCGTPIAS